MFFELSTLGFEEFFRLALNGSSNRTLSFWFMNPMMLLRHIRFALILSSLLVISTSAFALQSSDSSESSPTALHNESDEEVGQETTVSSEAAVGVSYSAAREMPMQFGMEVHSGTNYCSNIRATFPFPSDWPEQAVEVGTIDIPPTARFNVRELPGGVKQIVLSDTALAPQSTARYVFSVQVKKSFIDAPSDPTIFVVPKRPAKEARMYLGNSPGIDVKDSQVRKVAREIQNTDHATAWDHVEAIYDWVRDNIEYRTGAMRSSREAMRDRWGDCEELTAVFIAICRASRIPARCVWIPGHCYPEFYLEDENGNGFWFPCQAAGERQFGEMREYRPIIQKGDRFKVPEKTGTQRYASESFKCDRKKLGTEAPKVTVIRDLGELTQEIAGLETQTSETMERVDDDDA